MLLRITRGFYSGEYAFVEGDTVPTEPLPDVVVQRLLSEGYAERVDESRDVETATLPAAETTQGRAARRRQGGPT